MYPLLLQLHSAVRWLVLLGILIPLLRSYGALLRPRPFTSADRLGIAIGTSASHLQLLLGMTLYMSSPLVSLFWSAPGAAGIDILFFGLIHISGMVASVVVMSIGSSLAKRAAEDHRKFRAVAIYWTIAVLLILLLIPWPGSPLAARPLWRSF